MGCGLSRFSRSHEYNEEDIRLDEMIPVTKHRENMDINRSEEDSQREHAREQMSTPVDRPRRADVTTAQRQRANRSRSISVGTTSVLNTVIYFL